VCEIVLDTIPCFIDVAKNILAPISRGPVYEGGYHLAYLLVVCLLKNHHLWIRRAGATIARHRRRTCRPDNEESVPCNLLHPVVPGFGLRQSSDLRLFQLHLE
jgi:hypothetical protein